MIFRIVENNFIRVQYFQLCVWASAINRSLYGLGVACWRGVVSHLLANLLATACRLLIASSLVCTGTSTSNLQKLENSRVVLAPKRFFGKSAI